MTLPPKNITPNKINPAIGVKMMLTTMQTNISVVFMPRHYHA